MQTFCHFQLLPTPKLHGSVSGTSRKVYRDDGRFEMVPEQLLLRLRDTSSPGPHSFLFLFEGARLVLALNHQLASNSHSHAGTLTVRVNLKLVEDAVPESPFGHHDDHAD